MKDELTPCLFGLLRECDTLLICFDHQQPSNGLPSLMLNGGREVISKAEEIYSSHCVPLCILPDTLDRIVRPNEDHRCSRPDLEASCWSNTTMHL